MGFMGRVANPRSLVTRVGFGSGGSAGAAWLSGADSDQIFREALLGGAFSFGGVHGEQLGRTTRSRWRSPGQRGDGFGKGLRSRVAALRLLAASMRGASIEGFAPGSSPRVSQWQFNQPGPQLNAGTPRSFSTWVPGGPMAGLPNSPVRIARLRSDPSSPGSQQRGVRKVSERPPSHLSKADPKSVAQAEVEKPTGRAFETFEQAYEFRKLMREKDPKLNTHIAEILVYENGVLIDSWWEASRTGSQMGTSGSVASRAGHTEQLALSRMELRPGLEIEIRGGWGACTHRGGCLNTMDYVAETHGIDITYRSLQGNSFFAAGVGHIPEFFEGYGRLPAGKSPKKK